MTPGSGERIDFAHLARLLPRARGRTAAGGPGRPAARIAGGSRETTCDRVDEEAGETAGEAACEDPRARAGEERVSRPAEEASVVVREPKRSSRRDTPNEGLGGATGQEPGTVVDEEAGEERVSRPVEDDETWARDEAVPTDGAPTGSRAGAGIRRGDRGDALQDAGDNAWVQAGGAGRSGTGSRSGTVGDAKTKTKTKTNSDMDMDMDMETNTHTDMDIDPGTDPGIETDIDTDIDIDTDTDMDMETDTDTRDGLEDAPFALDPGCVRAPAKDRAVATPRAAGTDDVVLAYLRDPTPERADRLVRETRGIIYSTALRIVRDSSLAEDVTQEVYLDFFQNASRASGSGTGCLVSRGIDIGRGVLRRARGRRSRRHAVPRSRRGRGRGRLDDEDEPRSGRLDPSACPSPDPSLGSSIDAAIDTAVDTDDAISELPEPDRSCVRLRWYGGLAVGDIARHLGLGRRSAGRRLARSAEALRLRVSPATVWRLHRALVSRLDRALPLEGVPDGLIDRLEDLILAGLPAAQDLALGTSTLAPPGTWLRAALRALAIAVLAALAALGAWRFVAGGGSAAPGARTSPGPRSVPTAVPGPGAAPASSAAPTRAGPVPAPGPFEPVSLFESLSESVVLSDLAPPSPGTAGGPGREAATGSIHAFLVDESGRPLPGIRSWIRDGDGRRVAAASTGPAGDVLFEGIAFGRCRLRVQLGSTTWCVDDELHVTAGETATGRWTIGSRSIRGRVILPPGFPGAERISIGFEGRSAYGWVSPDSSGAFRIEGALPGEHHFLAIHHDRGRTWMGRQSVVVPDGRDIDGVEVPLPEMAGLAVGVLAPVDASGARPRGAAGASDAVVQLVDGAQNVERLAPASRDERGARWFLTGAIAPGTYRLVVRSPGRPPVDREVRLGAGEHRRIEVTLGEGSQDSAIAPDVPPIPGAETVSAAIEPTGGEELPDGSGRRVSDPPAEPAAGHAEPGGSGNPLAAPATVSGPR